MKIFYRLHKLFYSKSIARNECNWSDKLYYLIVKLEISFILSNDFIYYIILYIN